MKRIMVPLTLLVIAVLLSGCLDPGTGNGTPDTGNSTQGTGNPSAQYGDNVTVDYTLYVDGKMMDTSSAASARAAGTYNENRTYSPLTFQLLIGGPVIKGFVNGIIGMHVGETKNFTVSPEDGYGVSDPSKITKIDRYYNMSVFEEAPMSYFIENNITITNTTLFPSEVGYVSVHNFTNETVTLRYLFGIGHKFAYNGLPQTVVNITNDTMLIRFDMEENKSYVTKSLTGGGQVVTYVTHADNDTVVLDENGPLVGKELNFEVTLRAISR